MGPKKTNNKVENKQHTKCPYYDRGYCQHRDSCFLKHPEQVCDDENCVANYCEKKASKPM